VPVSGAEVLSSMAQLQRIHNLAAQVQHGTQTQAQSQA
jgi:hypothetical protein